MSTCVHYDTLYEEMDLLTLLSYEEDILLLVAGYLDTKSLLALEISSSHFRELLQESKVWRVAFDKLALATQPGYNWRRRLTGRSVNNKKEETESEQNVGDDEECVTNYKKMLLRLEKLNDRWIDGPTRKKILEFKDPVVDVAIDEGSIVIGLKTGKIVIADHNTLEIERTVETKLVRIQKLAVFQDFIYVGDLRNDRYKF